MTTSSLRQRHFIALTGFRLEERDRLIAAIKKLGGTYLADQGFKKNCSHVICAKPSRSEKFLGACATGKWILTDKFLLESRKAGHWLKEEIYEWRTANGIQNLPAGILTAPSKWRKTVNGSGMGAFAGWRAAVAVTDIKKKIVYKRLLEYGGSDVLDLKVPFNLTEVVQSGVLYVFLDERTKVHATPLLECGVLCLHPEYIGDFLVSSPTPDPINYLIDSPLIGSQRSCILSSQPSSIASSQTSNSSDSSYLLGRRSTTDSPMIPEFLPSSKSTSRRGRASNDEENMVAVCSGRRKREKIGLTLRSNGEISNLQSSESSQDSISLKNGFRKSARLGKLVDSQPEVLDDSSTSSCSQGRRTLRNSASQKTIVVTRAKSQQTAQSTDSCTCSKDAKSSFSKDVIVPKMFYAAKKAPASCVSKKESGFEVSEKSQKKKSEFESAKEKLESASDTNESEQGRPVLKTRKSKRCSVTVVSLKKLPETVIDVAVPSCSNDVSPAESSKSQLNDAQPEVVSLSQNSKVCDVKAMDVVDSGSFPEPQVPGASQGEVSANTITRLPRKGVKRKLTEPVVRSAIEVVKKRKVSENDWLPSHVFLPPTVGTSKENQGYVSSMPMTHSMCNLFESAVEEEHYGSSLDIIMTFISRHRYPTARVLSMLMQLLMANHDETISDKTFKCLMMILQLHPPSSPAMHSIYIQSFVRHPLDEQEKGAQWQFLKDVLGTCLFNPDDDEAPLQNLQSHRKCNAFLLLKYIVAVLEQDHTACTQSNDAKSKAKLPMLGSILWPGISDMGLVNKPARDLLDFLPQAISLSLEEDADPQFDCTGLMQSLIYLMFETVRLSECNGVHRRTGYYGPVTKLFLHELTNRLLGEFNQQPEHLQKCVQTMKSPHLILGVSQLALDLLDASLTPQDQSDELGLNRIVNHYFYLLPRLSGTNGMMTPKKRTPFKSPLTNILNSQCKSSPRTSTNSSPNISPLKFGKNINKRNHKGETLLHLACIKNNVLRVREILSVPGIDVNMKDFAGWTSLHEACNRGNVECVKELLNFKPHKTITSYFGKEKEVGVDLLVANEEGITPLHDAVLNDQKETVKLLLAHGGEKLLEPRTILGYSALDLAESEEMVEILNCKEWDSCESSQKSRLSMSFSSSQGSNCSFVEGSLGPCEEAYQDILGNLIQDRKSCTSEECHKYILFVYELLESYLAVHGICAMYEYVLESQACERPGENPSSPMRGTAAMKFAPGRSSPVKAVSALRVVQAGAGTRKTRSGRVSQQRIFNDFVLGEIPKRGKENVSEESDAITTHVETVAESVSALDNVVDYEVSVRQSDLTVYVDLDRHIKQFKRHIATVMNKSDDTFQNSCNMLLTTMELLVHDYME